MTAHGPSKPIAGNLTEKAGRKTEELTPFSAIALFDIF
jgi:hypothetical protein